MTRESPFCNRDEIADSATHLSRASWRDVSSSFPPGSRVDEPSPRAPRPQHPRAGGQVRHSPPQDALALDVRPTQIRLVEDLQSKNGSGWTSSVESPGSSWDPIPGTGPPGYAGQRS